MKTPATWSAPRETIASSIWSSPNASSAAGGRRARMSAPGACAIAFFSRISSNAWRQREPDSPSAPSVEPW